MPSSERRCAHPDCVLVVPWFACQRHWEDLPSRVKRDVWRGDRTTAAIYWQTEERKPDAGVPRDPGTAE